MSKKTLFLTSFSIFLVLTLAGSASAQIADHICFWSNLGDSNLWSDANSWYTVDWNDVDDTWVKSEANSVPGPTDVACIGKGADWFPYPNDLNDIGPIGSCLIDSSVTAECYQLWIGADPCNCPNQPNHLKMTGGSLTSAVYSDDWVGLGIAWGTDSIGSMTVTDGNVVFTNLDGEGGNLNIGGYLNGVATFTMTGGTVTCYHLDCPDADVGDLMEGYLNLYGGTLYTTADEDWTEFWMGMPGASPNSTVDVTEGKAVIKSHDENELYWLNVWIDEGKITAYGGIAPRAELYVEYDYAAGETTLEAIATELEQAYQPRPRPGRTVDFRPTLKWTPGDGAISHIVYFDTNEAAVEAGTAPNTPTGANSLYPGIPDLSTRYYWRVDEVNSSGTTEGLVWSYKTADYIAVDDFDTYANQNALWAVWDDYWVNYSDATIYIEAGADLVRAGQSLRYQYSNVSYTAKAGKYYFTGSWIDAQDISELGIGGDYANWSAPDLKALTMYFYGDPCATYGDIRGARMWVELEDTGAHTAYVLHTDVNDMFEASWHEWNIDLQDFADAGVVLTSIDRITIGIGGYDRTGQGTAKTSTAQGKVYLEDIRLYPQRCVPELGPVADVTGDCIVDYDELAILAGDWLESGYDINAVPPPNAPIARYMLEEGSGLTTANTGSYGATYNCSLSGSAGGPGDDLTWITPGAAHPNAPEPNYCIEFDGAAAEYIVQDANFGITTNSLTLTCWVKRSGDQSYWTGLVFSTIVDEEAPDFWAASVVHAGLSLGANDDWTAGGTEPAQNHLAYHWTNCPDVNDATPEGELEVGWWWRSGLLVPNGVWTFCAVAVEPEKASLYMMPAGGNLYKAVNIETHVPITLDDPFYIGKDPRGPIDPWPAGHFRVLAGQIDDAQIFDYALSDVELLYVAQEGGSTHVGLVSPVDFDDSDNIDFVDYGFIADEWLTEQLWPPE